MNGTNFEMNGTKIWSWIIGGVVIVAILFAGAYGFGLWPFSSGEEVEASNPWDADILATLRVSNTKDEAIRGDMATSEAALREELEAAKKELQEGLTAANEDRALLRGRGETNTGNILLNKKGIELLNSRVAKLEGIEGDRQQRIADAARTAREREAARAKAIADAKVASAKRAYEAKIRAEARAQVRGELRREIVSSPTTHHLSIREMSYTTLYNSIKYDGLTAHKVIRSYGEDAVRDAALKGIVRQVRLSFWRKYTDYINHKEGGLEGFLTNIVFKEKEGFKLKRFCSNLVAAGS